MGCRGLAGQSLIRGLKMLGVKGLHIRKAIKLIMDAAEKASRWLWIKRVVRGPHYSDTSLGLINPGWVAWARLYDVARPEAQ